MQEYCSADALNQIQHYTYDIAQLFDFNALVVVSDGVNSLHGHTALYTRNGCKCARIATVLREEPPRLTPLRVCDLADRQTAGPRRARARRQRYR
jgi:hypothetical protein